MAEPPIGIESETSLMNLFFMDTKAMGDMTYAMGHGIYTGAAQHNIQFWFFLKKIIAVAKDRLTRTVKNMKYERA